MDVGSVQLHASDPLLIQFRAYTPGRGSEDGSSPWAPDLQALEDMGWPSQKDVAQGPHYICQQSVSLILEVCICRELCLVRPLTLPHSQGAHPLPPSSVGEDVHGLKQQGPRSSKPGLYSEFQLTISDSDSSCAYISFGSLLFTFLS